MKNFTTLIENSKQAVRYWWLLLIVGIALFAVGVLTFVYPAQSYLGMSLIFGWLMRGFSSIGLGGDMSALEIPGAGWTVFTGVLLLLCSLWILFQPLVFGTAAVIVWVGITLLFAGVAACSLALQLRNAHRCLSGDC